MPAAMLWLGMVACDLVRFQEPPPGAEDSPSVEKDVPSAVLVDGSFTDRYRLRNGEGERDADLRAYFETSWKRPGAIAGSGRVSVSASADLDGDQDGDGYHAFDSLDDSYRGRVASRLHSAYVDVGRAKPWLRLGRQDMELSFDAIPFDGLRAATGVERDFAFWAAAGVPVNPFESSAEGDALGALGAAPPAWAGGRCAFEYVRLEDETIAGEAADDVAAFSVEHRFPGLRAAARASSLDRFARDAGLRLDGAWPDTGWTIGVDGLYSFRRRPAQAYTIDSFAVLLPEIEPYAQGSLRVSKTIGDRFGLDAAATFRRLDDGDDEAAYNREFERWTAAPHWSGWPWDGTSVTAHADLWRSESNDFWTLGGDFACRVSAEVQVGAGSDFALYEVDALTGEEREHMRILYASVRAAVPPFQLSLRVAFERNDLDDYTIIDLGLRQSF